MRIFDPAGDGSWRVFVQGEHGGGWVAADGATADFTTRRGRYSPTEWLVTDIDGDGKAEWVSGTEYTAWQLIGSGQRGRLWWTRTANGFLCGAAADIGGGALREIIAGSDRVYVYETINVAPKGHGENKRLLWSADVGGMVTDVDAVGRDGAPKREGEVYAASLGGCIVALAPDGTRRWLKMSEDVTRSLWLGAMAGRQVLLAATDAGRMIAYGRDGAELARACFPNADLRWTGPIAAPAGTFFTADRNGDVWILRLLNQP